MNLYLHDMTITLERGATKGRHVSGSSNWKTASAAQATATWHLSHNRFLRNASPTQTLPFPVTIRATRRKNPVQKKGRSPQNCMGLRNQNYWNYTWGSTAHSHVSDKHSRRAWANHSTFVGFWHWKVQHQRLFFNNPTALKRLPRALALIFHQAGQ